MPTSSIKGSSRYASMDVMKPKGRLRSRLGQTPYQQMKMKEKILAARCGSHSHQFLVCRLLDLCYYHLANHEFLADETLEM